MPMLNVKVDQAGMAGVEPKIIYIDTNNTVAEITATGYLNNINQKFGIPLTENEMALVSTKTSVGAASTQVGWYDISKSGDDWSLTASETTLPLTENQIFVGNSSGVATDVAMSGDVAIVASGATTIQTGAVESAMIANNAIDSTRTNANMLQYTTVSISAAAFNGAYVTPIELVPAAGANTLLVLDRVQLLMTYNSAAYAAGGVLHVQYDGTTLGAGIIASTTLAAATFQGTVSEAFALNAGIVDQPFTTCVNKNLSLSNITGAYTTGDSTMIAHVWYKEIPSI